MTIVAITGKRGSGKTSAAIGLENVGFSHINFADPVRKIVEVAYGVPMSTMHDAVLKETSLSVYPFRTPRELMQKVGTELFREGIDQDTWIEAFKRATVQHPNVVCSDCRFPNEAVVIRALGGVVIKIVNPSLNHDDAAAQHPSETAMDLIQPDYTLINDPRVNSIAQLQQTLIDLMEARNAR